MSFWLYFMTNRPKGTLYLGVTNNLAQRVWEHQQGVGSVFAATYRLRRLVWAEAYERIEEAIQAEKRIKRWRRAWKEQLIEQSNPDWSDLTPTL